MIQFEIRSRSLEVGERLISFARPLTLALCAAVLLIAASGAIQAAGNLGYVPNEYLIRVVPGLDNEMESVEALASQMGCTVKKQLLLDRTYLLEMGRTGRTIALPKASAGSYKPMAWIIESVQPNFVKYPCAIPNDALWGKMWDMVQIRMPGAWDIAKGSSSVVVAVNDTGVSRHPDLVERLLPGYDFVDNDSDASPEPGGEGESHGTHCAGTIAAQGNNDIGICGVCWNGVKILPIRVGTEEMLTSAAIVNGLYYALNNGANVVNMSYGGYGYDDFEHEMIRRLAAAGIILVAAAGNDGVDWPLYPAAHPEVVSVAATGPSEATAWYSNYGAIDIAAPGGDLNYGEDGGVWSTFVSWSGSTPIYDYRGWQGTSMAAPHVAGAAALLLSYGVPRGEVVTRMLTAARPPRSGGMDPLYYGAGILDVQGALSNVYVRVIEPGKGANVGSKPHFRIKARGVVLSTVKVYLDYADLDDNGVPDNLNDSQIINATNISYFWNAATETIEFDWMDPNLHLPQGAAPLTAGVHKVYVSAFGTTGSTSVSDWSAFYVVNRKFSKGIHMVSFPYTLTDRLFDHPGQILPGASFAASARPRSSLIRWMAAPRSSTIPAAIGYETYVPGTLLDRTWVTPSYTAAGRSVPLGGGYYTSMVTGGTQTASPVGSGFWLILPVDYYVDETFPTLESQWNFDGSKGFDIPLYAGWNMIGNPYTRPVPWRAVLFTYKGRTLSLLDAELAGWVRSTLYGYGGTDIGYVRITDRDMLQPYAGYWLLALVGGVEESETLVVKVLP